MTAEPAWLDRALGRLNADAIAATAAELIAIPTASGTPAEVAGLDHVADWLASRGVAVERWSVPAADLLAPDGWSAEIDRTEVAGLTASVGPAKGPGLLVNAHLDVVPADQPGWTSDPYAPVIADGWLTGRGAADTKGGLAAALHVLVALADAANGELPGRLVLTPVIGEEDGGAGTLASLAQELSVSAAVVVEPTGLQVASASAGALRFRVTVLGRTAHGSVRHQGVSAIEKGWLVHQALLDLERERTVRLDPEPTDTARPADALRARSASAGMVSDAPAPWPICIGRIEGGTQPCDVADRLVLDGRYGVAPHEDPAAARAELEFAIASVADADDRLRTHPPLVEWVGAQWLPAETPRGDPLVTAYCDAAGQVAVAMPYGSDAGLLRHVAGLPVVVLGPGEVERAHAADERVAVRDLGRFAELLLRGAARWWSGAGRPVS